jgi:hypothetical protein
VIVHLLDYRVVPGHEAEVEGFLRHQGLVGSAPRGMVCRYVGRRLRSQGPEHLAVSVWSGPEALRSGLGEQGIPSFFAATSDLLGTKSSSRYRVVASTGLGARGARVLRVYRTAIPADAVVAWGRQTLEAVGRLPVNEGFLTAFAGISADPPGPAAGAGGIVVTAWTDWDLLLAAIGGRLNSPLLGAGIDDLENQATRDHYGVIEPEGDSQ